MTDEVYDEHEEMNKEWLDIAAKDDELTVLAGGKYDDSVGYFIDYLMLNFADLSDFSR